MQSKLLVAAGGAQASAAGVPALLAGVLLVETGVPVPFPADLLVLAAGERAAAGAIPLWLAAVVLEAVAVAGTTALFLAARGPARALLERIVQRFSNRTAHLRDAASGSQQRHRATLALGRATPGLRTLTVIVAALAGMRARIAVPALVAGSTLFLQGHLLLGWAVGPLAESLLARARVAFVVIAVVLVVFAAFLWLRRRGSAGERGFAEGGCPACLGLAAVSGVIGRR